MKVTIIKFISKKGKIIEMRKDMIKEIPRNIIKEYEIEINDGIKQFSDWRLPTIKELLTLVDYNKSEPACDVDDVISSSYYWSSTNYLGSKSCAWVVYFDYGLVYYNSKESNGYVRCVRDSENGLEWSHSSTETYTWNEAIEYAKTLEAPVYYKG